MFFGSSLPLNPFFPTYPQSYVLIKWIPIYKNPINLQKDPSLNLNLKSQAAILRCSTDSPTRQSPSTFSGTSQPPGPSSGGDTYSLSRLLAVVASVPGSALPLLPPLRLEPLRFRSESNSAICKPPLCYLRQSTPCLGIGSAQLDRTVLLVSEQSTRHSHPQ